jgi:microcystin-dependent protein
MSAPFVGEVRPWACTFAPKDWAFCQGQILPIQRFTALFALLGTYYGGNGTSNFALPDLRGRVPIGFGNNPDGNFYNIGEIGGTELVQLNSQQMPVHNHVFMGTTANGGRSNPAAGAVLGTSAGGTAFYGTGSSSTTAINVGTMSLYSGGNQPHVNLQPYQAINWCIALVGVFPTRN